MADDTKLERTEKKKNPIHPDEAHEPKVRLGKLSRGLEFPACCLVTGLDANAKRKIEGAVTNILGFAPRTAFSDHGALPYSVVPASLPTLIEFLHFDIQSGGRAQRRSQSVQNGRNSNPAHKLCSLGMRACYLPKCHKPHSVNFFALTFRVVDNSMMKPPIRPERTEFQPSSQLMLPSHRSG